MENSKLSSLLEKFRAFVKHFMFYVIIVASLVAGFAIGKHYEDIVTLAKLKVYAPEIIQKEDVSLAIDENNNMLIINKIDGTYILYEDSIGFSIVNFYARNVFSAPTER